ncbi:LysR substrate-binding domain-containing protein [Microvirga tunisiensis]|jgi:DNA-binding transcriptional LysR family regulator|nr:LysR substrate-binding domain-containing protein [Microvirga tunisiensis]
MIDDEGVAMHLLDIDQLRTFVAIADTGSFTRAAEIVHKTQSAVSMQMKRLEDRVGKTIFERDGRLSKLTDEGERLLDYARRIVRLNSECMASFNDNELTGRVRLGLPDDYADRYLPEILARFSRSNPKAEVTVVCEPSHNLIERVQHSDLDLAIITHVDRRGPSEIVRIEQLLWVTSARHGVHEESPVPLALGRPNCDWRHSATEVLESADRTFRVAYVSYHSTAVGAAVLAGLAVSVLPESAVRPGMRILGPSDGFPALPSCKIGLIRARGEENPLADALGVHIKQSLDNLGSTRTMAPLAAE